MVTKTEVFFLYIKGEQPLLAEILPVVEPVKVCAGLAEKFKLHLLKFPYTEDKVTRSNLITE